MKNILRYIILLSSVVAFSQVGIGTVTPTKMLDIDGNLRLRTSSLALNEVPAKESILTVGAVGDNSRIPSKTVIHSYYKTFIKGQFLASSDQLLSLTIGNGKAKVPFNAEEFDVNNEFDTNTNTFTAKKEGLYAVGVQIKSTSAVGITTNFGVSIVKNDNIILAQNGFANIGIRVLVVNVNASPPIRNTSTTVKLNVGDRITFESYSDLVSVGLLGSSNESFFYIYQVR